jgi:hypothetical protein
MNPMRIDRGLSSESAGAVTLSPQPARDAITRRARRWPMVVALCAVVVLSAGCSALRVSYNQANWLAYRWMDAYVDFDANQEKSVKEAINAWFAWNRKSELKDYIDLLLKIEADIQADTTPERTCGYWAAIRTRVDRASDRAVPAIASLSPTLTPAQIENIERRYAKTNAEYREDFMNVDPAVRLQKAAKRVASRAEWLYGDLETYQRERIERFTADSPFDPQIALAERQHRQQDALRTLRRLMGGGVERSAAEADIRGWIRRVGQSPREAYRQHSAKLLQHSCRLAADIHNSTSPEQRRIASGKLKGWAEDLRVLAAQQVD